MLTAARRGPEAGDGGWTLTVALDPAAEAPKTGPTLLVPFEAELDWRGVLGPEA